MAVKMEVPFANQEGRSAVRQNGQESLLNMFAEIETSGHSRLLRRQRACLEQVHALAGLKRCIEKNAGIYYLIVGNKFSTWDGTTYTELGTLFTSLGRCTMIFDDNGDVLMSDGATAYHWDGATFTTPDTQGDIGTLTFLGGFAVGNTPGTGQFKWSAVNNMQSWDALDFATAEGKPDVLLRVFTSQTELWLFGAETIEIWPLTGATDSPFQRSASMDRGTIAPLSVVAEDNSLMWLGDDLIFYRADGFRPMRISNHSIERLIGDLPSAVQATCETFSYTDQGNKFITLEFPGYLALQLNLETMFWNVAKTYQRNDWDIMGSQFTNCDLYLTTTGISLLRRGINKDNGVLIERGGISPQLASGTDRVSLRSYFLDCEVGRAAPGIEPRVMLRVARDGEVFGNERWRSLGLQGDYRRRATWRNLGQGRKMTVQVMATDDFEFSIMGAVADGEVLSG